MIRVKDFADFGLIVLAITIVTLIPKANASSFEISSGFFSYELGHKNLQTIQIKRTNGKKIHRSESFCAITGAYITSGHESDPNQHHKGGHVRPVSYAVGFDSDGYWIFRHAGGRPSDTITVGCFRIKDKK